VRQANKRSIQARWSATQHRRSKEEQRCQSRRTHAWAMGRSRRFTDRSTPPRASVSRRGEGLFRLDRRGRTSARCAKAGRALRGCIDQSRTGSDLHTIAAQVRSGPVQGPLAFPTTVVAHPHRTRAKKEESKAGRVKVSLGSALPRAKLRRPPIVRAVPILERRLGNL
jgi:hypothetical protein